MMNADLQYEPGAPNINQLEPSLSSEGWKPRWILFTQSLNFEVKGSPSEVQWRSSHEKYSPWPELSGFMQSLQPVF